MADFDARINLEVTSSRALNTVSKVEAALDKVNQAANKFNETFLVKAERKSAFAISQAQQYAAALRSQTQAAAQFNNELERTARIQQQIQAQQRALPAGRGPAGLLPSVGGSSSDRMAFRDAARYAAQIDESFARVVRNVPKLSPAIERLALPAASSGFARAGGGSASVFNPNRELTKLDRKLIQEAQRQLRVTGRITDDLETQLKYRQLSTDLVEESVKTQRATNKVEKKIRRSAEERLRNIRKIRADREGRGTGGFGGAQQAALGIGFPLLFGGGPGAIIGGGLGALGGFGGSVLGSALGTVVDNFVADISDFGDALGSASGAVEELTDRNLFSSKATEDLANKLIKQGRYTEAAALASEELTKALGPSAIEDLKEYDRVTDELNKSWNKLTVQLAILLAGPLAKFIEWLADVTDLINERIREQVTLQDLDAANQGNAAYQRRRDELIRPGAMGSQIVTPEAVSTLASEFPLGATARITPSNEELEEELGNTKEINKALRDQLAIRNQIRDILIAQRNTQVELVRLTQGDTAARQLEREAIALNFLEEEARIRDDIAQRIKEQPENEQLLLDLQNKQLTLARSKADVQFERVKQLDREAEIQREIYRTETARQAAATQRGLDRDITGAQSRLDNFGDSDALARSELAIRQANRFTDAIRENGEAQEDLRAKLETTVGDKERAPLQERLEALQNTNTLLRERLPLLDELEQKELAVAQAYGKIKPVADAVAQSALTGIRAVIEGTATAEEAFASFLNTIVDLLLKAAAEQIATYIAIGIARQFAGMGGGSGGIDDSGIKLNSSITGGGLLPKEVGGRTMANMPYVVGESGPELFVPGKTGTIVPTDVFEATRNAIQGNAPQGGDSDAFEQNSVALGNSASITKENSLVREMGMRENEPIDVRYESTVINNVSYVSEEQFQKGLKSAVAQSKSAVFGDLKNKPSARAGIGLR